MERRRDNKLYYGWWIVGACFTISLIVQGSIGMGFSAFIDPLHKEFGWSYAQIALASSLRGLNIGLLAPVMGLLVDKYGPRVLMFFGSILAGLSLILFSRAISIAQYYGTFILLAIGVSALSPTVTMTAVANWFHRRAGIATGIMHSGVGFSGLIVPVIVILVDSFGWRAAAFILGLCFIAIISPLSLLMRHKPEQYGLMPDGDVRTEWLNRIPPPTTKLTITGDDNPGIRSIIKSNPFWHISIAFLFQFMMVITVVTHVMPYMESMGLERGIAGLLSGAIPLVSVLGRVSFGWLGDRFDRRKIMGVGYLMMGLGMLFYSYAYFGNMLLFIPFVILFSSGFGGNAIMRAGIVRECFGRRNFGTILGFVSGIAVVGQFVGPPVAGWVFDKWGSFHTVWFVFALLSVVPMILIITIRTQFGNVNVKL